MGLGNLDVTGLGVPTHCRAMPHTTRHPLQQLVGRENFNPGLDAQQEKLLATHMAILGQWQAASLAQMEQADAIIILAEDVNNSAPRIALSIRQALLNQYMLAVASPVSWMVCFR